METEKKELSTLKLGVKLNFGSLSIFFFVTDMASKDEFLLSMLQTSATNRALITEIGADDKDSCSECAFNDPSSSGGPSLLEQMMAAQQEAKRALDSVKQEERKKASGSFGNGFKKGFLSSSKPKKSESSSPKTETPTTIRAHIPKSTASNFVIKEVQDAMVEEPNPVLNQLKTGGFLFFLQDFS